MGKKSRSKRFKNNAPEESLSARAATTPAWVKKSYLTTLAMMCAAGMILIGVVLRIGYISTEGRSPDEGIYTMQAASVAQAGVDGLRKVVREYNAVPEAWIYPPPTRIGYIFIVGTVMKLTGIQDVRAGIYTSACFSILSLFVVALIGFRFLNPWITAVALLCMAVSPPELAIARRSWQDGFLSFFSLILIYLSCLITKTPARKWLYVPFVLIGTYCVLIKESGIVVYGLCAIWVLWVLIVRQRSYRDAIIFTVLGGIAAVVGVMVLAGTVGGIGTMFTIFRHVKEAMPTNVYAIEYQSGPWYLFLLGVWILMPAYMVLSFLGIGGILAAYRSRSEQTGEQAIDKTIVFGLSFVLASFVLITMLTPYCQNIRYVSAVYGPFYLLCGVGVWSVVSMARGSARPIVVGLVVLCLAGVALYEYKIFDHIFLQVGIRDLSIKLLRDATAGYRL